MRKTKLVLLACRSAGEGPWVYAQGNEFEIKISALGHGERIELKVVVGELRDSVWFDQAGNHPIPFKRMEKYQVVKHTDADALLLATNVEVVLNGSGTR